jgi:hypothetical protein
MGDQPVQGRHGERKGIGLPLVPYIAARANGRSDPMTERILTHTILKGG